MRRFDGLCTRALARVLTPRKAGVDAATGHQLLRAEGGIDFGWGRLYGGQVMAQALAGACATVPREQTAHSMTCAFVREGRMDAPPEFLVEPVRDGRSFATRRVRARQAHGDILDMMVNFHVSESGFEHQLPEQPASDGPEALGPNLARMTAFAAERDKTPEEVFLPAICDLLMHESGPIVLRPELLIDPLRYDEALPPAQRVWLRAKDSVGTEDGHEQLSEAQLAQVLLAFSSDFVFLGTALLPHQVSVWHPSVQPASLTHSLFFHRPVSMDDWLQYEMQSPVAAGARGFVRGELFEASSGKLVASAMQDGLIRKRDKTHQRRSKGTSYFS